MRLPCWVSQLELSMQQHLDDDPPFPPPLAGVRGMLVAAGLGTRLAPLTDLRPKPVVPVGLRPVAAYMLDHFRVAGITDVVVNLFHLPDVLRDVLTTEATATRLSFVQETELLGTGGGIRHAFRPRSGEDFMVANAKLLFRPALAAAMQRHQRARAVATMVVKPMPAGASFGAIDVDADGFVRRILDPAPQPAPGLRRMMFTGVQVLNEQAHRLLPQRGCVVRDGYRHWLTAGLTIATVVDSAPFWDVGMDLPTYHQANMAVRSGKFIPLWPQADAAGNLLAPGVSLPPSASIIDSIIGVGAQVAPDSVGERLVVWPGAKFSGDHSDAIVTPHGIVPVAAATAPTP